MKSVIQTRPDIIQWVTDFGDQSVVLPVACVVLLFLCLAHWRRGAFAWIVAIVGTLGIMLLLKLGMGACSWEFGTSRLDSPSGHTASATVLYGSLLVMLRPRSKSIASLVGACLIALTFAISRLILHDHTIPEVVIGALVGIGAALVFYLLAGPVSQQLHRGWMLAAIFLVVTLVHGHRLPAEQHVHSFATTQLRAWLCPKEHYLSTSGLP